MKFLLEANMGEHNSKLSQSWSISRDLTRISERPLWSIFYYLIQPPNSTVPKGLALTEVINYFLRINY